MFIHILLFHIFLSPIFQCLSFWCSTHQPHLCSWAHRCSNFGPFCFQTKWMTRCTSQSSSNWQDFPPPLFFKTSPQVRLYYSHHFQLALHPEMFIHNPQLGLFLPPYWLCGTSSYDHRCKLGQGCGDKHSEWHGHVGYEHYGLLHLACTLWSCLRSVPEIPVSSYDGFNARPPWLYDLMCPIGHILFQGPVPS